VLLALAAGAAVVLLSDGSDDQTQARRDAVSAYIVEVNKTQQTLIVQLERINRTYRQLDLKGDPTPAELDRVDGVERTLKQLRSRFAALDVPVEARRLHREILRLVDLQAAFAHEVAAIVRFLPIQAREQRKLSAATVKLRAALVKDATVATQRAAFDEYRATLGAIVLRLEQAEAPPVLEPARTGEIARLTRFGSLAEELADALVQQDADKIDRLSRQFVQTSGTTGATRAERNAVIAFNSRLAAIGKQRTVVNAARNRVDLELR
jgi:hypothetical protein